MAPRHPSPLLPAAGSAGSAGGSGRTETLRDYEHWAPAGIGRWPDLDELVAVCTRFDLRGRGGAGFPPATKLAAVHDAVTSTGRSDASVRVVANGDEGEPASMKDRYLLARRPHLVLVGTVMVVRALGADRAYVYMSEEQLVPVLGRAAREWSWAVPIEVFAVERSYFAGEESAVVRAISEGIPKPTAKPPRPFEHGVDGHPTLVCNVETLAQLARFVRARIGDAPGISSLVSAVPDVGTAHLIEVPATATVAGVLRATGCAANGTAPRAVLAGGFSGGFLPREQWDLQLNYASMQQAGALLGCGALLRLMKSCPIDVAVELATYFERQNAKQCGVCINGTRSMSEALARVRTGVASDTDIANLGRWSSRLRGRGVCALLDGATHIVSTQLRCFEHEVVSHGRGTCVECSSTRTGAHPLTRSGVSIPDILGATV